MNTKTLAALILKDYGATSALSETTLAILSREAGMVKPATKPATLGAEDFLASMAASRAEAQRRYGPQWFQLCGKYLDVPVRLRNFKTERGTPIKNPGFQKVPEWFVVPEGVVEVARYATSTAPFPRTVPQTDRGKARAYREYYGHSENLRAA